MSKFNFTEIKSSEIPEKKAWGSYQTERSKYVHEMLDAMACSKGTCFKIDSDENGIKFENSNAASKFCTCISAAAKRPRHKSSEFEFAVCMRGKRIFVSKLFIAKAGR